MSDVSIISKLPAKPTKFLNVYEEMKTDEELAAFVTICEEDDRIQERVRKDREELNNEECNEEELKAAVENLQQFETYDYDDGYDPNEEYY